MKNFASSARGTRRMHYAFVAFASLLPAAAVSPSFNRCDPADRTPFNGAAPIPTERCARNIGGSWTNRDHLQQ